MKEIQLTRGQVAIVDDIDYERLLAYSWYALYDNKMDGYYAVHNTGRKNGWKRISMHRFVTSAKKGQYVDHINHNTLDNRRCNLRICRPSQNQANARLRSDNSTGYKGVRAYEGRYYAIIRVNGKGIHLGGYNTPQEAGMAYDKAAIKYFGEFALTNKQLLYRAENAF
jgi:hypothetical protein